MSFFAVLFALLLEQLKPLPRQNWFHDLLVQWVGWTSRNLDAGAPHHARIVWAVTVILPAAVAAALYVAVQTYSDVLALVFDVAVLYLTLGFRQFSHYFTDIRAALDRGDEAQARQMLAEWRHLDASDLPRNELLRHVIEHSLLAAHRHVFGVFFAFVVFSAVGLGPAGALLYRMAEFASRYWARRDTEPADAPASTPVNPALATLARRWFALLDHVPARLTAFGFAVVGNFEEAINSWRRDAGLWMFRNEGIILAAAAGAVGIRLGGQAPPVIDPSRPRGFAAELDPEDSGAEGSTPGLPPQPGHLQSVVGLVWRSVVLWMMLVALLTLANLLG